MIRKCSMILFIALTLMNCGPDTIFLRPGLDTPEQHVDAGYKLLECGKVADAYREFRRARELNPQFVKAYVGIGLALGLKGDINAGLTAMNRARELAQTPQDHLAVREGFKRLDEIRSTRKELNSQ